VVVEEHPKNAKEIWNWKSQVVRHAIQTKLSHTIIIITRHAEKKNLLAESAMRLYLHKKWPFKHIENAYFLA